MTGHTSDEVIDVPQENRSTDSESATKQPKRDTGVVQDGPGTPGSGVEEGGLLDEHGNYRKDDSNVLDAVDGSEAGTPVSDRKVQPDGTGEHGRPTDDSDPGHS